MLFSVRHKQRFAFKLVKLASSANRNRQRHSSDASGVVPLPRAVLVDLDGKPLGQHKCASVISSTTQALTYSDVVAEADELLQLMQTIRPARQATEQRGGQKARRTPAAKDNPLAVVRVRVRLCAEFLRCFTIGAGPASFSKCCNSTLGFSSL